MVYVHIHYYSTNNQPPPIILTPTNSQTRPGLASGRILQAEGACVEEAVARPD